MWMGNMIREKATIEPSVRLKGTFYSCREKLSVLVVDDVQASG